MSVLSDYPMSNKTTYRVSYTRKECPRTQKWSPPRDYDDPIAGPLKEHLLPYRKYNKLPKPTTYPDPEKYNEQLCERFPNLRSSLMDPPACPPDFDLIDRLYDDENRSEYMVAYCRLGDFDSRTKQARQTRPLPEGWVIPLTTQRCGYRDPRLIIPEGIPPVTYARAKDVLVPNEKERAILGVTTGESDYMFNIGRTGQEIIDGKLHGDVNMRPQFSQDELLRAMLIRKD